MNVLQAYAAVAVAVYSAYMCWVIVVAVRGGPEWRSGHPGDILRVPRNVVIASSIAGTAVALVCLGFFWSRLTP